MEPRLRAMPILALSFATLRPFVAPMLGPFIAPSTPALMLGIEATHGQAQCGHTEDEVDEMAFHGGLLRVGP